MLTLLTYSINVYTAYIKIFKPISQIMRCSRIFLIIILSISVEIFSLEVLEVKILNSYTVTKEFPGKLLPTEQSKLSFEIPGKIKAINVDVGDLVFKGDILAELDDREAVAQVNQAKATFDLSKQVLNRFEDLKKQGHISIQELDKAKSDFIVAESQYEFFKVKLEQTKIISPYDGAIQNRYLDTGTVINAGVPILEILDSNFVEAHISVPILYLDSMKIGEEYDFNFEGSNIKGIFTRLSPMSPGGSDSRLAIFKFSNFFSPGSITKLKLKIIQQATGTWVPLKTLSQSEQGIWTVYTINQDNQVVRDLVEIIYFEGEYAYVNGTLKNGDLIVLGGPSKIIEGKNLIN